MRFPNLFLGQSLVVLVLVAVLQLFWGPGLVVVHAQENSAILNTFKYGFFAQPSREPTLQEINDLICAHSSFYTARFQTALANPQVLFEANNIDWSFAPSAAQPLNIYLAVNLTTADGSELPSLLDLAFDTDLNVDYSKYIEDALWSASDYWLNVNSTSVDISVGTPNEDARLARAECDPIDLQASDNATATPTALSADSNTTSSPTTAEQVDDTSNTPGPTVAGATNSPTVEGATNPPTVAGATNPPTVEGATNPPTVAGATNPPTKEGATSPPTVEGATNPPTVQGATSPPTIQGATSPPTIQGATSPPTTQGATNPPTKQGATNPPTVQGATSPPTVEGVTNAPTKAAIDGPSNNTTLGPSSEASAPNTDNMVYFIVEYGFGAEGAREPTEEEVSDLVCQTNRFMRDVMRNDTNIGDPTVQTEAMYVDWSYTPGTNQPITVQFLSNTTFGESGEQVPEEQVLEAMQVTQEQILFYIENYVWATPEDSVFQGVVNANFTTRIDMAVPLGQIEVVDCPDTPAPATSPTVSPAPTKLASPTVSPSPTLVAPTVSPAPSGTDDTGTASPTGISAAARETIEIAFIVSNIDGIDSPDQVNSSGLAASWPVFVDEVTANITANLERQANNPANSLGQGRRLLSLNKSDPKNRHRRLTVALEPGTAFINTIEQVDCPTEAHPDATCHDVRASYVILLQEESADAVKQVYTENTQIAVDDGSYQTVMETVDPGTPLYIGIIPPSLPLTPSGSPATSPTATPGSPTTGPSITTRVENMFWVSNLEDITAPSLVSSSGLSASWPVFVEETVFSIGSSTRKLRKQTHRQSAKNNRLLAASYQSNSAEIVSIQENACPADSNSDPDAVCHVVEGAYTLELEEGDDPEQVAELYRIATSERIDDGTYQEVLDRVEPDSPLVIGFILLATQAPTVSSAPSISPAPSGVPTATPAPTISSIPSIVPSVPLSPTIAPTAATIVTFPPQTVAPVANAPNIPPSHFRSTGIFPIKTEFIVSNLEGITDPIDVQRNGLYESWHVFARGIVENITVFPEPPPLSQSKRRRWLEEYHHRRLSVAYVPDSANITGVVQTDCGEGVHVDSTCHNVKAQYQYEIVQEILLIVNATFYNATNEAIYNGTYQYILDTVTDGKSPLIIGYISPDGGSTGGKPADSDDDKLAGWAIFLIILAILLCCLCLALLYYFYMRKEEEKELQAYSEEDFVYDFFVPKNILVQTEADDVRSKPVTVDEDEEEVEGSTASSDDGAIEDEEQVQVEEEDWESGDDMNRSGPSDDEVWTDDEMEETANVVAESVDEEEDEHEENWQDEIDEDPAANIGTSEYAAEAHRLLLESGNDENVSGPFLLGNAPAADDDQDDGALAPLIAERDVDNNYDSTTRGDVEDPAGADPESGQVVRGGDILQRQDPNGDVMEDDYDTIESGSRAAPAQDDREPSIYSTVAPDQDETHDAWQGLQDSLLNEEEQNEIHVDGEANAEEEPEIHVDGEGDVNDNRNEESEEQESRFEDEHDEEESEGDEDDEEDDDDEETDGGWDDVTDTSTLEPEEDHDRWA